MSKTLRYYISRDKQVKPYPQVGIPLYQKGGNKNSNSYAEKKRKNEI